MERVIYLNIAMDEVTKYAAVKSKLYGLKLLPWTAFLITFHT